MNKPTKQTLSALRSVLDELTHLAGQTDMPERFRPGIFAAKTYAESAIAQITEDKQLACGAPGCHVVKPTVRALSAHRSHCVDFLRECQRKGQKTVMP